MSAASGWIEGKSHDGQLVLAAGGSWIAATISELDRRLRALPTGADRQVVFDLAAIEALDSAGAWLVLRTRSELAAAGRAVELVNLGEDFLPLLRQVEESGEGLGTRPSPRRHRYEFGDFTARLGRITIEIANRARDFVGFIGLVSVVALRLLRHPRRLRFTALVAHMEQTGVDALPIVGLLSFLIGIVFTFQGADQLRRVAGSGAEIYTVNLLGISILRELGGLLAAIILAGRSGSAFTAQIGTMKVNEEVDAMQVLGLDPVEILVMPRLLAMVLTLPLVTFYSNIMGLVGGALMAWSDLGIAIPTFLRQLHGALSEWTFWLGLLKAPVFAGIIALTGCYEGLRVARSAESVGRQTTRSVVESIFLIIVADAVFSIIFSLLGI